MENVDSEAHSAVSPSYAPGENPAVAADMQHAVELLHWSIRDLFLSTFSYGNAGTEADVAEHLRTGDHVIPAQAAIIHAALNDGLRDSNSPFRV